MFIYFDKLPKTQLNVMNILLKFNKSRLNKKLKAYTEAPGQPKALFMPKKTTKPKLFLN